MKWRNIIVLTALLLTALPRCELRAYNFEVSTAETPNDFADELKLESDLDSEYNQGRMKIMGNGYKGGTVRPSDDLKPGMDIDIDIDHMKNPEDVLMPPPLDDLEDDPNAHRYIPKVSTDDMPIANFVGTNLFDGNRKKCFSAEDVALLAARKDFESLIPKDLPQCLLNDSMVNTLMHYFCAGNQIVRRMSDEPTQRIMEKAFYDTLGGYLHHYVAPVAKTSFYGGHCDLKTVQNINSLYQQCQLFLNTNGNGWRAPIGDVLNELTDVRIDPLDINLMKDDDHPSYCGQLDMTPSSNDAEDDQMIVPLPKLDPEDSDGFLGNIWLPFKRKRTYNLRSEKSADVLAKYYETVSRCYHFQSLPQDTFNKKFRDWIMENIQVHLDDAQCYPGLGSILKVYEHMRRGRKAVASSAAREKTALIADEHDETALSEEQRNENGESTAVVAPKKRQKTDKFLKIEEKVRKLQKLQNKKANNWFEDFYESAKKGRTVEKKKQKRKRKPKCKPKQRNRSMCRPKPVKPLVNCKKLLPHLLPLQHDTVKPLITKPHPKGPKGPKPPKPPKPPKEPKGPKEPSGPWLSNEMKTRLLNIVTYMLYAVLLFLLLWLLLLCCKRVRNYIKSRPSKAAPSPKKQSSLFQRLSCCRKKKQKDETVLIKPTSSSVIWGKGKGQVTDGESTSSLFCHPKSKCLPLASRSKAPPPKKTSSTSVTSGTSASSGSKKPKEKKVKKVKEKKPKEKKVKIKSNKCNCKFPCKGLCKAKEPKDPKERKDSKERKEPKDGKKSPRRICSCSSSNSNRSTSPRKSAMKPARSKSPPTPKKKKGGLLSSKCCSKSPPPPPPPSKMKFTSNCLSRSPSPPPPKSPKRFGSRCCSPKSTPKSSPKKGKRNCDCECNKKDSKTRSWETLFES